MVLEKLLFSQSDQNTLGFGHGLSVSAMISGILCHFIDKNA